MQAALASLYIKRLDGENMAVMETATLLLFSLVLVICIVTETSVLYALLSGLVIFSIYAICKGFTLRAVLRMWKEGVLKAKNILVTFLLIGMLTALWRGSGTIALIVYLASDLISPAVFLLMTFLLNSALSFLTGTSFGTAATIGVVCAGVGASLGVLPSLTGGAILSGAFFGDRCSPVSTSALLVSNLTGTDIYRNIRNMLRSAALPFLLTAGLYLLLGFSAPYGGEIVDLRALLGSDFNLSLLSLLPALVILILSAFRVKVKLTLTVSILTSLPIFLTLQGNDLGTLFSTIVFGYQAETEAAQGMMNGGGIVSMVRVSAIVCISSAYSGIFEKTALLASLRKLITAFSHKTTHFAAMLFTSILTSALACNQTLSIMLTEQLCADDSLDKEQLALELEDSAVLIAPLIPWSIAGAVPLASAGEPTESLLFAFFLYLVPLCSLIRSFITSHAHPSSFQSGTL